MVAATLLAAAPLVAFLTENHYPLITPEVGILLAACVAAGVLLGLAAAWGATAAALLLGAGTALAIDLMYGAHLSKPALVLVAALCLALSALLRRHIALVVTAVSAVFLATTLLIPSSVAGERVRADLPVVVHLILDEHIGLDGLPKELPESAAVERWLTDAYLQAGFRLYAGAYSEYFDTRHSIANLLNFTSYDGDWAHLAEGRKKPYVLTDSAYFRHLSALGYRLHVYQSDYMDFCRVPAVSYAGCFGYRANSIASLQQTTLGTVERAQFIFNSLVAGSNYLDKVRATYRKLTGWPWEHAVSRVGPLAVLPVLARLEADLRSAARGHAYFAHLLVPHYPYVLDEACRVREEIEHWLYNVPASAEDGDPVQNTAASRAERYRRYFAQIRCQQALLHRLFDALKAAGVWHDALVVVHGDHGSRIVRNPPVAGNAARLTREDLADAFSTLFAVHKAGLEAGVVGGPRPLQELLAEALEVPMSPLAPKRYLRAADGRLMPLLPGTGPAPRSPAGH
jgi:hypothetical protein